MTGKIMKNDEMTISIALAPWIENVYKEQYRVPDEKIQKKMNYNKCPIQDPAKYIFPIQIDEQTGKQFRMIETVRGKRIRVAVNPENDPDEPLYTQEEIKAMGDYLLNRKGHMKKKLRDYAYFVFAINTWRRAGDNLNLKIQNVMNEDGTFKEWLEIIENKTGKKTSTPINSAVCDALRMYLKSRGKFSFDEFLFPANSKGQQMTVDGMNKMLKRAAQAIGINRKIGTHSLRKTGAYHYVMTAGDKSEAEREVSHIFGHSSIQITRRYLMIEKETLKRKFEERQLEIFTQDEIAKFVEFNDI